MSFPDKGNSLKSVLNHSKYDRHTIRVPCKKPHSRDAFKKLSCFFNPLIQSKNLLEKIFSCAYLHAAGTSPFLKMGEVMPREFKSVADKNLKLFISILINPMCQKLLCPHSLHFLISISVIRFVCVEDTGFFLIKSYDVECPNLMVCLLVYSSFPILKIGFNSSISFL